MSFLNRFKTTREQEKNVSVNGILKELFENTLCYSHSEQTEIINRVLINVLERKKIDRTRLIEEARELQNSMINLKI